jgi:ABC-2 type transport system permease protein
MSATSPTASGPRRLAGLGNLTGREAAAWWATGRWRLHMTVWTALLAGLLVLMLWVLPALLDEAEAGGAVSGDVGEAAIQFPDLAAVVMAIGVVLLTQGILLDERRNGVLEWLLSKPVARPAVVLAKFLGQGSALVVTIAVVPWVAVHLLLSVAAGRLWSPTQSLAALGALMLVVAFHLALMLALSTLTTSRVAVLAVPIVLIVASDGITSLWPELFHVLPWSLGAVASVLLADGVLVSGWPLVSSVVLTVLLLALASAALQRAEL